MESDEKSLKWTENGNHILLTTPIFTVNETDSIASDGQVCHYIILKPQSDWVMVVPKLDNDFIMVKQWRHGENKLSIEFPGGVIDYGETPQNAAKRELLEETGYEAQNIIHLGTMNPNPALMTNHIHFYLAENLINTNMQHLDKDEYLHFMKINKNEVINNIGTNEEYSHALMAAALSMYLRYEHIH